MRKYELLNSSVCALCAFRAAKLSFTSRTRHFTTTTTTTSERLRDLQQLAKGKDKAPTRPIKNERSREKTKSIPRRKPRTLRSLARLQLEEQPGLNKTRFSRAEVTQSNFVLLVGRTIREMRQFRADSSFQARTGLVGPDSQKLLDEWTEKTWEAVNTWDGPDSRRLDRELYKRVYRAWLDRGHYGIGMQLRFALQGYIANTHFDKHEVARQARTTDLRYPVEWYPKARLMAREIHLHIGPTNSGKTYHALQRLQNAQSGVYAGPLRLLAHEVYGRMLAKGRTCNLVTGDERIISEDPNCMMSSSTVEMIPLGIDLDVAVIDEIQMIGDRERGWAWTQAVLGVQAREVHLCGEVRALPLLRELAASTGDKLIVHKYERLSPLGVADSSLEGDLKKVRPGDCLVAFSRAQIHAFVNDIRKASKKNVAVVYGSLPPEIRAEQARLFNDPDSGYDVLVASNAIGMGLNLSIKRIIFTAVKKYDGQEDRPLAVTDVKQIGGRAGRFRIAPAGRSSTTTKPENVVPETNLDIQLPMDVQKAQVVEKKKQEDPQAGGLVTTLHKEHLPFIRACMGREPEPITTAGLKCPDEAIMRFASYFPPETPLSYIMNRLTDVSRLSERYKMCDLGDNIGIADAIQPVKDLSLADRLVFCASPAQYDNPVGRTVLCAFARCVAKSSGGDLLSIQGLPLDALDEEPRANTAYLQKLEDLHRCLTLYLWLSFRFRGVFVSQALAVHVKGLVEEKINQTLAALAAAGKIRKKRVEGITEAEEKEEDVDMVQALQNMVSSIEKQEEEGNLDQRLRNLVAEDESPRADENVEEAGRQPC